MIWKVFWVDQELCVLLCLALSKLEGCVLVDLGLVFLRIDFSNGKGLLANSLQDKELASI